MVQRRENRDKKAWRKEKQEFIKRREKDEARGRGRKTRGKYRRSKMIKGGSRNDYTEVIFLGGLSSL